MDCTPRRYGSLFLILFYALCFLLKSAAVQAEKPLFKLHVLNSDKVISCEKLRLDPGSFRCKRGDTTYRYKAEAIETVTYKDETVYPYDTELELTEQDLYTSQCSDLVEKLKCPLLLENNPNVFILVGTMYEKGICTRQNIQQAFTYYRKAGKPGMKKYAELRRKSS
jgi:TPR repeat protein